MELNQDHGIIAGIGALAGSLFTAVGAVFHFGARIGKLQAQVDAQVEIIALLKMEVETMRAEHREDMRELRLLIAAKGGT